MSDSRLGLVREEAGATMRLAGPLIGGQLALIGMNFVDTVMAGSLNAEALAAVAIGSSVWSPIMLLVTGVLMAAPPAVAQYQGAGKLEEIAPYIRQVLWLSLCLGVAAILAAVNLKPILEFADVQPEIVPIATGYLKALCWGVPAWSVYMVARLLSEGVGKTLPTLYFGLVGLLVNIPVNYVLMHGHLGFPALGAVGCGYATAVVWWVQCLGMLIYVAKHPDYRRLALFRSLEPFRREHVSEILRVGIPIGLSLFIETGLFAAVSLLIGSLGTVIVAGHQVALNFAALTFMVPLGISMAITIRVGNAVGRGDLKEAKFAGFVGIGLTVAVQFVSASIMFTMPQAISQIYTRDPAIIAIAVQLLFLAAIFQLSDGLQVGCAGALRGYKDTQIPMRLTIVAYWLVGLPLGYFLGLRLGYGAEGVWIGLIFGLSLAALLLLRRMFQVSRRKERL
ncbi:MAG: MATE family efflux transporter [Thermoanaerobaculia bacterium]